MTDLRYEGYEAAQGWNGITFGTCSPEQRAYFDAELSAIGVHPRPTLRVLDVGFGNGALLGWYRSHGVRSHGVELNPRMVRRAEDHGYMAAADFETLRNKTEGQRYDVITAFDVLEHIDRASLVRFLTELKPFCNPDTVLLFRFPNGDNPFSLPLQNGDVTHVTAIGQSMMRQIAALAGFDIVSLRSPTQAKLTFGLRRLLVMFGLPLRLVIGIAIRHLFMAGMQVEFSANLVSVMRLATPPPSGRQ